MTLIQTFARYATILGIAVGLSAVATAQPVPVTLKKTDTGWQLLRNGQPYVIKGVGGSGDKKLVASLGCNSFRTWGIGDDTKKMLDEAQSLGMTVTLGIWVGHERHGFNYNNAEQVGKLIEQARDAVTKFKDHPALLAWAVGNEMEGFKAGDNAAIWITVNHIAAMIKSMDPNHPTMTVITEIGGQRVECVNKFLPAIDMLGINSYGGVPSLVQRYKERGGTKPIIVTEYGPPGTWEVKKTAWDAAPELTSTQKAEWYANAYRKTVMENPNICLGSYAFTWGFKQEATATWFGMLLPDGSRLQCADELAALWGGTVPANRCPRVEPLTLSGPDRVDPGQTVRVSLKATDPDNDKLDVRWSLSSEASEYNVGGEHEVTPPSHPEAIVKSSDTEVELKMPADGGGYRLFVQVRDGHGGAATASLPLFVNGPEPKFKATTAKLPMVIVGEDGNKSPYIPSGWMGNHAAMGYDEKCTINPHSGTFCSKVEYRAPDGFGGIVWQDPANDWGNAPGGRDLTGATRLVWWARGEQGGERVKFTFGVLGPDKKFHDTATDNVEITLSNEWKEYSFKLTGKDLKCIKTGFVWVVAGQGKPITFYLDDVRYE